MPPVEPTFDQNTYAGQFLQRAMVRAFTGNQVIRGGHAYLRGNVRSTLTLPRMRVENIIQDRAATPTSQGTIAFEERKLTTKDYMVYVEFNPRNMEGTWVEQLLSGQLLFAELPPEVQAQIVNTVLNRHDNYMGKALWVGDEQNGQDPYNKFDGFITLLAADAATNKPGTQTNALAADNILNKLATLLEDVDGEIIDEPSLKVFMSHKTLGLYGDALRALDHKSISYEQQTPRVFEGKTLVPLYGFPNDTLLCTVANGSQDSNLWVGVSAVEDLNAIQVEKKQANSELWFLKMLVKCGVQVPWPELTYLYQYVETP